VQAQQLAMEQSEPPAQLQAILATVGAGKAEPEPEPESKEDG